MAVEISCPNNETQANDRGLSTANVTWSAEPSANDSDGSVIDSTNITCVNELGNDVASMDPYPVGQTTVNCTAQGENETASCVFYITVNGRCLCWAIGSLGARRSC